MNPQTSFALVIAIAAVMAGAPPVLAQPAPDASSQPAPAAGPPSGRGYGAWRGGGRGFDHPTTLTEYQARFRDRILQADADHDGKVSLAEWTAYQAARDAGGQGRRGGRGFGDPTRQFQTMDTDRDGYLTPAEIDAASAQRFASMDANHDGVLTPEERHAMRGGMGPGDPNRPPE